MPMTAYEALETAMRTRFEMKPDEKFGRIEANFFFGCLGFNVGGDAIDQLEFARSILDDAIEMLRVDEAV